MRAFVIKEADFFQVVSPNRQGPRSGGFSEITFDGYLESRDEGRWDTYSCPVFLITKRILFLMAKTIPWKISEGSVTLIA